MTTQLQPPPTLTWHPGPGKNQVTVRPWLDSAELEAVQALFRNDTLAFGRVDDPVLGTGTTICPQPSDRSRPVVEQELRKLWGGTTPPHDRPLHRPAAPGVSRVSPPAPYGPRAAPKPVWEGQAVGRAVAPAPPRIVFAVDAYLKYMYMCHTNGGRTEVGGCGVHVRTGNVIRVVEFVTARQKVDPIFCSLDPAHVSELAVERCLADPLFNPNQLTAVWCHTHPGNSVTPSNVDWATFDDLGGDANAPDWAAMVILGKDGTLGAHIRQRGAFVPQVGPATVEVDYTGLADHALLARIDPEAWAREYDANIRPSADRPDPRATFGAAIERAMWAPSSDSSYRRSGFGGKRRRKAERRAARRVVGTEQARLIERVEHEVHALRDKLADAEARLDALFDAAYPDDPTDLANFSPEDDDRDVPNDTLYDDDANFDNRIRLGLD